MLESNAQRVDHHGENAAMNLPKLAVARGASMRLPLRSPTPFLLSACALLPFSTSVESAVGVQSFGLPVLTLCTTALGLSVLQHPAHLSIRSVLLLLLAWTTVAWICFTAALAPLPMASFARALVNLLGVLFLTLALLSVNHERAGAQIAARVAKATIVATSVCALYYIANLLRVVVAYGAEAVLVERFVGGMMSLPWGASNMIASVLLLGMGMTLIEWHRIGPRVGWVIVALHVIAIGSTLSRNGIALAAVMLLWGCGRRARTYVLIGGALGAVALVSIAGAFDLSPFEALMEDRFTGRGDVSNGRVDTWLEKIDYLQMHPLAPVGYYGSIYSFDLSAHNFLLNTLVEQGIPGALAALGLLFFLIASGGPAIAQHSSDPTLSYRKLWIVMALNMAFEDPNFTQPFVVVFWLVVTSQALRLAIPRESRFGAA